MAIQPRISLVVMLLSTLAYPVSGHAGGDFADTVISGLRSFDSNVSAIQEKGFGVWLSDHITDKAWEHVPDLFGAMSDTAKNAQTAGTGLYQVESKSVDVITSGFKAYSSSNAADLSDYQQKDADFSRWLPDEQRDLTKEGLQMSMPESLMKLADKVQTFYDNTQWVGDKLAEVSTAVDDSVASVTRRVQGYVADVKSLGLEPGSANYDVAATATNNGNPVFASNAEATVTNDDDSRDSPSDAATSVRTPKAQDNDLVSDLRGAGWDNSTTSKDSSAINSDDLAALGGDTAGSSTQNSNIDTNQLQADLSDWDKQQAALLAQVQEKARQDTLAKQQEAEESAQRAEAARLAREQAESDADNESDSDPSPPRKSGGGFWDGLAQSASLAQQILSLKGGRGAGLSGSGGDCTPPAATNAVQQCAAASGGSNCGILKAYASCLARAQAACGSCGSCISAIHTQQMSIQNSASVCN
jgi:hypothetical protein